MIETALFFIALFLWSLYATHHIVFVVLPSFAKKKETVAPAKKKNTADHARPQHSAHDGFRAYAKGGELTVDDIVKALSREE
jgi:hypothetical protein